MHDASGRIREYDGLKGIAIIGILFVHLTSWSGVEITFVLNAVLLSKSSAKRKNSGGTGLLVIKNILRILPVYYLGLTVHLIAERIAMGRVVHEKLAILLHYAFLHGLSPLYWDSFGMGYMGVLFVMWTVFPLYIKKINNFQTALITGIFTCIFAGVCYNLLIMYSPLEETQRWYTWLHYMLRGVYCYSMGPIVFYAQEELSFDNLKMSSKLFFAITFFSYIILNVTIYRVDYLTFAIMIAVIIWLIPSKLVTVLRFPVFVFVGEHIFELFVGHVTVFYVMVLYLGIFKGPVQINLGVGVLSFISAILLKRFFAEPMTKILGGGLKLLMGKGIYGEEGTGEVHGNKKS